MPLIINEKGKLVEHRVSSYRKLLMQLHAKRKRNEKLIAMMDAERAQPREVK